MEARNHRGRAGTQRVGQSGFSTPRPERTQRWTGQGGAVSVALLPATVTLSSHCGSARFEPAHHDTATAFAARARSGPHEARSISSARPGPPSTASTTASPSIVQSRATVSGGRKSASASPTWRRSRRLRSWSARRWRTSMATDLPGVGPVVPRLNPVLGFRSFIRRSLRVRRFRLSAIERRNACPTRNQKTTHEREGQL